MKVEIEDVDNGYILTVAREEYEEIQTPRKFVIQELDEDDIDDEHTQFKSFSNLVEMLQDIFFISNSKHNKIGFVHGICSEDKRWEIQEIMKESLKNPKNDLGD